MWKSGKQGKNPKLAVFPVFLSSTFTLIGVFQIFLVAES